MSMGLLDELATAVERHPDTREEQHSSLVQTAMQMFGNHAGLSQLIANAESSGVGSVVQSWIGTGSNQPITPEQVQGLLGEDRLRQFAQRAGIPPSIASAALARILPAVVDKFTPHGRLPQAA
ncbi:MAG TPA: YidB family protein [Candidatus Sulfotelmatobacter sp.]|nr:YidB family protein [Candidatus Sulfotelmatobacter sp.]